MNSVRGSSLAPDDPVAVIGVSCRVPMAPDPESFWKLLGDGGNAITEVPAGRWDDTPEEPEEADPTRYGGFVDGVDLFDPDFFGISPREAAEMDPQQRLMLELSWEALDDAGIVPRTLDGTPTGVFVGAIWDDYATLQLRRGTAAISAYTMTGQHRSVLANRVSYALGLHGPSLAVDAGQSSSLVAVHLACTSLRAGEIDTALVGGVNLNLVRESALKAAKFGGLSPDGRCFTFDARANGYVRGEGGAVVVLKRLRQAITDGDDIYCVIRGSAVNNDGGTPSLTVPSQRAQEEVLREACARAGVDPVDVQYVELHGTGTKVGDPIEAAALGAVFGEGRAPGSELLVGSVKTNIGHLEGAAGIAGLLKVVLSVACGRIPSSLNFTTPNPDIPLDRLGLRVQQAAGPWPVADRPPLAGVSSFGMGGTNCHVVLSGPPQAPGRNAGDATVRSVETGLPVPPVLPWPLSARTRPALRDQAERLRSFVVARPGLDLAGIGLSLAATRTAFDCRAVVTASGREEFLRALEALASGDESAAVIEGPADGDAGGESRKTAFLFSGQGSQRPGMGRELYELFPVFAATVDEACRHFDARLGQPNHPLKDVMFGDAPPGDALLDQTVFTQAGLFTLETALYRLAESYGHTPDLLLGHSVGEIVAAHVAGVASLEDACALVAARGRLMQSVREPGAMVAMQASEDEARDLLSGHEDEVSIAAVNGPDAVVISGAADAVLALAAAWRDRGRKVRRLTVSHAFHSPHMDPIRDEFCAVVGGLALAAPAIPVVSNLTGEVATAEQLRSPDYWASQLRHTVRFMDGVRTLAQHGAATFVEFGPDAVLTGPARDTHILCTERIVEPVAFASLLRRGHPEARTLTAALARAYANGAEVTWAGAFPAGTARVRLPGYAFQRKRYWLDSPGAAGQPGTVRPETVPPGAGSAAGRSLRERLAGLTPEEGERVVLDAVRTSATIVLGHAEPGAVGAGRTFRDLGFDSMSAVEFCERLARVTGMPVATTLTFDFPTPKLLAEHLYAEISGSAGVSGGRDIPATVAGASEEPIAIIAMSCRYPGGVDTPEGLWTLVAEGADAISGFPADRGWEVSDHLPREFPHQGGFLHDASDFDAAFFGISPREALAMDPQQRLLLEIAWEAIERAGISPVALRGSDTGVFVGVTTHDYGPRMHEAAESLEGYVLTGSTPSVASGRVAYTLGLRGPAISIDTACSSSLVALHLAAQALRGGECDLALAGGVTVMATPGMFTEFSRQGGLAPDGRCKPFSAAADGTNWAEGTGLVVVERLSDALANGHPVQAVIRGSAINQDGASNGLTAPSGPSQERVIRQALASARLSPGEVDAVEAHGTGTTLGDPIEARALIATYGQGRSEEHPLRLGSVKSNIGHAQAAAGIAGVIKTVMAMRHGTLPATLHVDAPSRHVDWSAGTVSLLTEAVPWPEPGRPRRAGVSSFGISGTNAHVILEEHRAPEDQRPGPAAGEPGPEREDGSGSASAVPWPLSARTGAALREQARRLRRHLAEHPEVQPPDVGFSLVTGRADMEHRAVLVGEDRAEFLGRLDALVGQDAGAVPEGVVSGVAAADRGQTVFVFPGQGSQWAGMATALLAESAVFRARIEDCAAALAPHTGWSLLDVLRDEPGAPPLTRDDVVQPALFAMMVSLAEVWRSLGVEPDAVVGHSQGEIAAAAVAGALSLDEAATIVAVRSRAVAGLAGHGAMASVRRPAEEVRTLLARWGDRLEIAAVNGPRSAAVSGDPEAIGEFVAACESEGVQARRIGVDYASHCAQVEVVRDRLLDELGQVTPAPPRIAFYSTVTGCPVGDASLDAEYWYRNLRETVAFERAATALLGAGHGTFIEVSPHPVLTAGIEEIIDDGGHDARVLGTLRRDEGGWGRILTAVGQAHVRGVPVNWLAALPRGARPVGLPTYAFQRERYWLRPPAPAAGAAGLGQAPAGHPLLAAVIRLAGDDAGGRAGDGGVVFTGRLSADDHPWLADHVVEGTVLLPGTAFAELARHAADHLGLDRVTELTIEAPLPLPERGGVQVQVAVGGPDGPGDRPVSIYSRDEDGDEERPWTRHARGLLGAGPPAEAQRDLTGPWPPPGASPEDVAGLYARLAGAGYQYGPAFRGLDSVWRRGEDIYAGVSLREQDGSGSGGFGLHPALLDAVLHAAIGCALGDAEPVRLPFSISGMRWLTAGATSLRARITPVGEDAFSLVAAEPGGLVVASIDRLTLRPAEAGSLGRARDHLFVPRWIEIGPVAPDPAPGGLAIVDCGGLGVAGLPDAAAPPDGTAFPETVFPEAAVYPDMAAFLAAIDGGADAPATVLLGRASASHTEADSDVAARARAAARDALDLLQTWLADDRLASSTLVLVTSGAAGSGAGDLVHAPLWGLVRSALAENPGRFILVDVDADPRSGPAIRAALASGEPQVVIREGTARALRLRRPEPGEFPGPGPRLDPEGTVLITGGTGTLGARLAHHLVTEHGARRLLLASRRGVSADGAARLAAGLAGLGAEVTIAACDAADREALAGLLASIPEDRPLTAVAHLAGVLDDATIGRLTAERLDLVLRPKLDAAWNLHALTENLGLSAFILFASVTGLVGTPGQANYAAANTFLDALAEHRHARGLPAASLDWGHWAQASGMTSHLSRADLARLGRGGIAAIDTGQALALFDLAVSGDQPVAVPARLDAAGLRSQADAGSLPAVFRDLIRVPARPPVTGPPAREQTGGVAAEGLAERMVGLDPAEQDALVGGLVRTVAAAVLGHAGPDAVEPGRTFREIGFDSLTAVELRNRLAAATGLRLPVSIVFDYPTPEALAGRLTGLLAPGREVVSVAAPVLSSAVGVDLDPVVVVGVGCRFPGGVTGPEELWGLVAGQVDAVGEFPADRGWDLENLYDADPSVVGKSYTRSGGFLYDAAEFDAGFFGISPREALAMDPQQRLLLECAWEAFEDAGIDPAAVRGSQTGVFAGVMYHDYGSGEAPEGLQGHLLTGAAGSVASGRVSYVFGFEGPAVTVDTACSSSLTALHLAVQSLRRGECSLALAGGVTVMATPGTFVEFSRQGGLAADGRCKAYGVGADGTGWAEGAGLLLVERLSDAVRGGHRVLGVVAGTAVNQDGASNGLTAPNGPSQERVIAAALADAGIGAADVDAVDGHGTGTRLGDPIEVGALLATYGQGRDGDRPLWLGSVKSNIGHAQAAAGVAGVIKMLMALRHEQLPATLHAEEPSPHIDWDSGHVALLTAARPWPRVPGWARRAGVSAFGISGTNAHVIIEEPPVPDDAAPADGAPVGLGGVTAWPISAKTPAALAGQAGRLADFIAARPDLEPAAVAAGLGTRPVFGHRAVVTGTRRDELLAGLGAVARDVSAGNVVAGIAAAPGKAGTGTVLVFPGQGGQWDGMGAGLLASCPVFADEVAACDRALEPLLGWRVSDVLAGAPGAPALQRPEVVQPALFTMMVATAKVWRWLGISPTAVAGHSQGEIAAAYVAGILTLDEAARVVAARGAALSALAETGAMASVRVGERNAAELAARWPGLTVAAVNSPSSVVISGPPGAVGELVEACTADGIQARLLAVDYASHSAQVEPVRGELVTALAGITPRPGNVPFWSGLTGERLDGTALDAQYWYDSLRGQVRFASVIGSLAVGGADGFIEVGPHPVLTVPIQETIEASGTGAAGTGPVATSIVVTGTLRREDGGPDQLLAAAARVFVSGVPVNWPVLTRGIARAGLPPYAFQRGRYWLAAGTPRSAGPGTLTHPLLDAVIDLADGGYILTGHVSPERLPWLADHAVAGTVLLPGTAFVEIAVRAGDIAGCPGIGELVLEAPLVIPARGGTAIQVRVGAEEDGRRAVEVYARGPEAGGWVCHARGVLTSGRVADAVWTDEGRADVDGPRGAGADGRGMPGRAVGAGLPDGAWADLAEWPPPRAVPVEVGDLYAELSGGGYEYGPAFRGLRAAWRRGGELFAEIGLPDGVDPAGYGIHPALLDAALHALALRDRAAGGLLRPDGEPGGILVPFSWDGAVLHAEGASALRVAIGSTAIDSAVTGGEAAGTVSGGGAAGAVSVRCADPGGRPVFSARSLTLRTLDPATIGGADRAGGGTLLTLEWDAPGGSSVQTGPDTPADLDAVSGPGDPAGLGGWAVLGDGPPAALADRLGYPDVAALAAAMTAGAPAPAAVAACLPAPGTTPRLPDRVHDAAGQALSLLQDWLACEALAGTRLIILTRGAVAAPADMDVAVDPAAAAIWGLVRSAQTEHPGRLALADADTDGPDTGGPDTGGPDIAPEALAAIRRLGAPQAIVRDGRVLTPRLARSGVLLPPPVREWRVETAGERTLDTLTLAPCPALAAPPGEGMVRVAVHAAGVNFHDVLVALGALAGGSAGANTGDAVLGSEGAGVIEAVGAGVTGLAPGDRVMTLCSGMGPVAVADHRLTVKIPPGWSFEEAAGVPVVFMTALYGLAELARLRPGEAVLIHAGTGGVGMAALQLARHLGAEVFATSSPGKWDVLRSLGLDEDHIASSRTTEFEERFRRATGGRGVDVILNSLTGELTDASLRLLAPGGRFIEIGKADVRDVRQVAAAHPGVDYRYFALLGASPDLVGRLLRELMTLFESGALRPLPVTTWDVGRAAEAFRYISQARHTGKVVLRMPPVLSGGTVLVTGGTGTLGGLVAEHLVTRHGAGDLVLLSRRGADAPGAAHLAAELAGLGATVRIVACDAGDRAALAGAVDWSRAGRPLTGVVHCAGVLQDGPVELLTAEQLDAVLRAKADAAWHLHELTAETEVAAFAVFSSAAGVLGTAGQANYAAANAFADALAAWRRRRGLAGVSLAWGLWEPASAMTGVMSAADRARLARSGLRPLSAAGGLALLDAALGAGDAALIPVRLDLDALRAAGPQVPPLLAGLAGVTRRPAAGTVGANGAGASGAGGNGAAPAAAPALAGELTRLDAAQAGAALEELVTARTALVLGHSSRVQADLPFRELGLDSLTAIELRNQLNAATGLSLPTTVAFDYPTPAVLAAHLLSQLRPAANGTEEDQLRHKIAAIPLSRLRAAGVMEILLDLIGETEPDGTSGKRVGSDSTDGYDDIDEMDMESLIDIALTDSDSY